MSTGGGRVKPLAVGLAIAGAYLLVALGSFALRWVPRAPVLDGLQPPPPYQWVKPPPARASNNKPPQGATQSIDIGPGDTGGSVTTPDGQCQVVLDANSVPLAPGQTSVKITMTPIDPSTVGPPPPGGFVYDSNAYQVSAAYEPSGQAITSLSATIVMAYATNADRVIQWTGSSWNSLPSTPQTTSNELFAGISSLGTFATAVLGGGGNGTGGSSSSGSGVLTAIEIIVPFGLIIAAVGFVLVKRFSRR
ncbi:MAG TPA: hypothetical protein VFW71_08450 [Actinomycetota bacterium]|nr:hypothetical protein [Actinomycetota bacterium]